MRDGQAIARARGGKRIRGGWSFRCPCHDDRNPSAAISERSGLVTCFAGCDRKDVEAALDALDFKDNGKPARRDREKEWVDRQQRVFAAQRMWDDALHRPGDEEVVAWYLREQRGITISVPTVMRVWNCNGYIACLQQLNGEITAVQTRTARGERTTYGPMERGAVQLAPPLNGELGLAEGLETALSATQLFHIPCWAVLGSKRMHHIAIPPGVRLIHLFIDNDIAGHKALTHATQAYTEQGYDIRQWVAEPSVGDDWNDVLKELAYANP